MSRFRNLWFPLMLAIILGGLSAWLERVSTVDVEEVKLDPDKPQYWMDNLSGRRFDETGTLKEILTAERGWQLPEQKNVFLQQADLQTFLDGQPQYSVNGALARYHLDEKKVYLEQGVVLEKVADAKRPSATVTTDYLTVDTVAQTAQTDAPIQFVYGKSSGSANGMFYDHKSGKLDLPKNVKALIYDVQTSH